MAANPVANSLASIAGGGREAAIARRRALSAGKTALPPATERVRNGERTAVVPADVSAAAPITTSAAAPVVRATAPAPAAPAPTSASSPGFQREGLSCRELGRVRRAWFSRHGRGDQPPTPPTRPLRPEPTALTATGVAPTAQPRQFITRSRLGTGSQVTGVEAGAGMPVSGTLSINDERTPSVANRGPKVGLARTAGGGIVSGSMVRSLVAVTGDEAGNHLTITGEADGSLADDVTERPEQGGFTSSQFQRQVEPHGHSVFGSNLGRNAGRVGSRDRERQLALESTQSGLAITGSAVGRTSRMTGDEDGACLFVTGDQYMTPARAQAECGGKGGGTAPMAQLGSTRRDPASGGKVVVSETQGKQRITGVNIGVDSRVTGDSPGQYAGITGTAYQGAPATGSPGGPVRAGGKDSADSASNSDPLAVIDRRFSVRSPQRQAYLKRESDAAEAPDTEDRITGSFAVSLKRVTGNLDFGFRSRRGADVDAKPARLALTGEGRSGGRAISGNCWSPQNNVTGTEGFTSTERNPSERQGKPQAFAGAQRFKTLAVKEDHKQLVTGMFGWSGKTAAKVTLSGGAQG